MRATYILVIGNAFAHKYVSATVDALTRSFPREKIVALGLKEDSRHNVTAYASGHLTDAQMHNLLHGARVVVFPSHYEGFGIPVVESLAYAKPVLARSIPVIRELREQLAAKENLILYGSTKDLMARLEGRFSQMAAGAPSGQRRPGQSVGRRVRRRWASSCGACSASWSFTDHLLPRLAYMRVLEDHRHELHGPVPTAASTTARKRRKTRRRLSGRMWIRK